MYLPLRRVHLNTKKYFGPTEDAKGANRKLDKRWKIG
jgi:hypothetical protein